MHTNINIAFTVPNVLFLPSADPRLLGALRRTGGGGGGVVEMKEWMQRICVSIHLESRSSLPRLRTLSNRARDGTIFTLHNLTDFYADTEYDHSCFHNLWPNSKTKLKVKHLWTFI